MEKTFELQKKLLRVFGAFMLLFGALTMLLMQTNQTKSTVDAAGVGKIELTKKDSADSSINLQGAEFDVKDASKTVVGHIVTGADGKATTNDLPLGEYTLVETKAPAGYVLDTNTKAVTLKTAGVVETIIVFNVKDKTPQAQTGKIEVTKTDEKDAAQKLANAEFEVKDANAKIVDHIVTNANGVATTKDLPLGIYTLTEVKAPAGYALNSTLKTVNLTKAGAVEKIVVTNEKVAQPVKGFGRIKVIQTDEKDKSLKLAGAVYDVIGGEGKAVDRITTDKDGVAISKELPPSTYSLVQVKAPAGYIPTKLVIPSEITKDGEVVERIITNAKAAGKIIVSNFDKKTGARLSGMTFKMRHLELGLEQVVDMKHYNIMEVLNLPAGTYEITEVTAAPGYELNKEKFTVKLEKDDDVKKLDIYDIAKGNVSTKQTNEAKTGTQHLAKQQNQQQLPQTGGAEQAPNNHLALFVIGAFVTVFTVFVLRVKQNRNK